MVTRTHDIDVMALLRLDEGLVHSDVYSSAAVFDLEMEKIYHRGWVYVGHESEIPGRGDYAIRWIGAQSVIMNRDDRGKVNLFMNRCRHRANSLCQSDQGNASVFQCAYHGWSYKNSGELIGVPYREGAYGPDFDMAKLPLVSPRIGIYRGFVWGNVGESGITLDDHLGPLGKKAVDLFCDASPEGEVILRQGCNKSRIYANWKFQGGDGYHPPFTHQANFMAMRAKRKGGGKNPISGGGRMDRGWLSRDLGNGHYCLDVRSVARDEQWSVQLPDTPWAREYRNAMVKSYGQERADYIIGNGGNPHAVFMPNVQLLAPDVRVLRPIAVDEFEIAFYCAFLKGAPDELNELRLRDTEDRMGPAGSINTDDVDMFERNQFGMRQKLNPWKYMARGIDREHRDDDPHTPEAYRMSGTLTGHYSDEVTQRAQLRWWAECLSKP